MICYELNSFLRNEYGGCRPIWSKIFAANAFVHFFFLGRRPAKATGYLDSLDDFTQVD